MHLHSQRKYLLLVPKFNEITYSSPVIIRSSRSVLNLKLEISRSFSSVLELVAVETLPDIA